MGNGAREGRNRPHILARKRGRGGEGAHAYCQDKSGEEEKRTIDVIPRFRIFYKRQEVAWWVVSFEGKGDRRRDGGHKFSSSLSKYML